jgi:hypothetical protein
VKVYAIATATSIPLSELRLYTSKVKAEHNKNEGDSIVELDVDEYPTIEELQAWLNTLTNPENMPEIDTVLRRAGGYGLMWEVLYSAHERQDEPDFEIVDALQEACYRWDI